MRAYLFSIGESTTELAQWALERQGHTVTLLHDPGTTLWQKYCTFLELTQDATEPVLRCDADVIVTRGLERLIKAYKAQDQVWWMTGQAYCYLKHDLIYTAPNIIAPPALAVCRRHIHEAIHQSRPETYLTRTPELFHPRRFHAVDVFVGIHGYRQREDDVGRVLRQKAERHQLEQWDTELIDRINAIT